MKKTINQLNKHWWYRLVKVIYVITFLLISIIVFTAIIIETKPLMVINSAKSSVLCNDGRQINFKENNIYFTETQFLPHDIDNKIKLL